MMAGLSVRLRRLWGSGGEPIRAGLHTGEMISPRMAMCADSVFTSPRA
jgi:hypothetical protein